VFFQLIAHCFVFVRIGKKDIDHSLGNYYCNFAISWLLALIL
jgi:hypothetical protein